MDLRRLRAGEWILAVSGLILLASLFLPWYTTAGGQRVSGFESMAVVDVLLAAIAASAVAALPVTAAQRVPAVPLALEGLISLGGILALLLVLLRVIDLPGGADARDWGLWVGLAAALAIPVGGFVAMRDERRSKPGRHVDLSGRPTPEPPEIEPTPLPRSERA
jgi:hypothetical protein